MCYIQKCALSVRLLGETSFQARKYKSNHSHQWYIVLGGACATKCQNPDTVTRMQIIIAVKELGQLGPVIYNFSDQRYLRKYLAVLS